MSECNLEFTGERIIPGQVDVDLLNEHLARYVFAARLARGRRVLDVGCGSGYGTAELARVARVAVGADLAPEAVQSAHADYRSPNLAFLCASCTALPFPDGAFDLVTAFEVIEHIADWPALLAESRRVLAPGGQFLVSTPNAKYYAASRAESGPNPYHVHEFEYQEFREALARVFPHVSMYLENHADGIVFRPLTPHSPAEVCVAAAPVDPEASHFFLAVCASTPQVGAPTFVYLPRAANVLRERELHIAKLEGELAEKDKWLEELRAEKEKLVEMYRTQQAELEARNRWAEELNKDLEEASDRIVVLQDELAREQAAGEQMARDYEEKLRELENENEAKTRWALETEKRLGEELEATNKELVRCVELLDAAERTVVERTEWAQSLEARLAEVETKLAMVRESRWVRMGRIIGVGPGARDV